jgi:hypothetical protein
MTAIASSAVCRPRSSTASFVIEEVMTTPRQYRSAHGSRRAFADFDDPAFDLIARAQLHKDLLVISAVGLAPGAGLDHGGGERGKLGGDGEMRLALDRAIMLDDAMAERRQFSPAAMRASVLRRDDWLLEKPVQLVD